MQRKIEKREQHRRCARESSNAGWIRAICDFLCRKMFERVLDGQVELCNDRAHFAERLGDWLAGFDGGAAGKVLLCFQQLGLRVPQTFDSLGKRRVSPRSSCTSR